MKYYKHIDGLRALSVTSILIAHCQFSLFSRGFVGVNVFFVISGFLISKIIIEEVSITNKFDFYKFYCRRIQRILPALFFMLISHLAVVDVNTIFAEYANQHKNIYFINPYDTFCNGMYCDNVNKNGEPFYSDIEHLSQKRL